MRERIKREELATNKHEKARNLNILIIMKTSTIILTVIFSLCLSFGVNAQQANFGKITGSVFDQQDAVILGNEITIENQNFRRSVLPNDDGIYTLEVPAGVYSITTKQGIWYSIRRAKVLVRANETTVINLNPTIRVLSIALEVTSKGVREPVEYNNESKFEDFFPFSSSLLNAVVEFRSKKRKGSVVEYRNAKLTYNNQSVLADIIRLNKNNLSIVANGRVTVDENGNRRKVENATLQIYKIDL